MVVVVVIVVVPVLVVVAAVVVIVVVAAVVVAALLMLLLLLVLVLAVAVGGGAAVGGRARRTTRGGQAERQGSLATSTARCTARALHRLAERVNAPNRGQVVGNGDRRADTVLERRHGVHLSQAHRLTSLGGVPVVLLQRLHGALEHLARRQPSRGLIGVRFLLLEAG